jgi:hypothetical protein
LIQCLLCLSHLFFNTFNLWLSWDLWCTWILIVCWYSWYSFGSFTSPEFQGNVIDSSLLKLVILLTLLLIIGGWSGAILANSASNTSFWSLAAVSAEFLAARAAFFSPSKVELSAL